ncbi:MAG TPA: DUF3857 domain-containing protein, partial [Pyrinomonadaceae bacterium]|nr:DUF3857 domain-containing protein [Pyrinomonadaceae bacterium]
MSDGHSYRVRSFQAPGSRIILRQFYIFEVMMKRHSLQKLYFTLALCSVFFFAFSISAQDKDWRPIPPEDLASKTAEVEPGADAEAIFWEVRVDDSSADGLALKNYVRVKIFTERGRDQFSKHYIFFTSRSKIKDLEARVTKPDGSTS